MWTSAWLAMDIALYCALALLLVTRGQAKSSESSLVRFPQVLWFLASSNQPCLEQLTEHLMGSLWQSLLQELRGLILEVMLGGTHSLFLTEMVMERTCSNR